MSKSSRDGGYSLVEVLLASAILLVITVSILPLFSRSLQSNLTGGRASQMATFTAHDIEGANQRFVDHPAWNLGTDTCEGALDPCLKISTNYFSVEDEATIGDEEWEPDTSGGGLFLWERTTNLRKYTYADILPGNIDLGSGTAVVPLGDGHPELFDRPLSSDTGAAGNSVHMVEYRVTVEPYKGTQISGSSTPLLDGTRQMQMTSGHFRTY